jgi:hypothetical protein
VTNKQLAPVTQVQLSTALPQRTYLTTTPAACFCCCPAPQIAGVSRRLLELHALLGGGGDVDVVWMVTREPQLLTASRHQLMSRLMAMRVRGEGGCSRGRAVASTTMCQGVITAAVTFAALGNC